MSNRIVRWDQGRIREDSDDLAEEEPLEIRVGGRAVSVTMRTPGNDDELAAGFLLSELLIQSARDILAIENCDRNPHGNIINIRLSPDVRIDFEKLTRHVFASSSCGLCGKATIDAIRAQFPPIRVADQPTISAEIIAAMPEMMRQTQSIFDRTGGIHAAGLFSEAGKPLVIREDIGRHNAVDKAIGHALLNGLFPLDRHVLLVSGRASFEIMQKSLAAMVPIVASVSAPSSLAVKFAADAGQTLIGFLRGPRMNVYAGAQRVYFAPASQE
ncbi:MAG TPA: formate dehydrogenase accessory sulfurtransferase FdhD [Tepidisphaeraceae bacterium]